MREAKVSIIVTCFNYGHYIAECLTSVKYQSFTDWECIVIDDGSTDNSQNEVLKFISDTRISYIKQENSGVAKARNLGISKAKGEFLLMLDADDKLHENALKIMISHFEIDPETILVTPTVEYFGSKTGIWELPIYTYQKLLEDNMIVSTSLFRKSVIESIGNYDINMLEGSEDWEFWIRMLKHDSRVIKSEDALFYYRIKPESRNTTILNNQEIKFKVYRYISKKHSQIYAEYFESPLVLFHQKEVIAVEKNYIIDHPLKFWVNRLKSKINKKLSGQ